MSRPAVSPRLAGAVLALVAGGGLAAQAPAQTPQVTAATPQRIGSLVPAATEVLFAIGAGDRVVAVGDYDDYPPAVQSLPRLGGLVDPNLETILAVQPDLVVVDPAQGPLVAQLEAVGIETYGYATGSIEEMLGHMRALGERLGVTPQAEQAATALESELAAVRQAVAGKPTPDVLVVFGRRPGSFAELWVSGGRGALHDMVELAGGRNVFDDVDRPSFKSGLEGVLARPPRIVVEAATGVSGAAREALEAEWRALPGFDGVRLVPLEEPWMLRPSPRVAELVRFLAAELHGIGRR